MARRPFSRPSIKQTAPLVISGLLLVMTALSSMAYLAVLGAAERGAEERVGDPSRKSRTCSGGPQC